MGGVQTCKCNYDCENFFDLAVQEKQQKAIVKNELFNPKFSNPEIRKPEKKLSFPKPRSNYIEASFVGKPNQCDNKENNKDNNHFPLSSGLNVQKFSHHKTMSNTPSKIVVDQYETVSARFNAGMQIGVETKRFNEDLIDEMNTKKNSETKTNTPEVELIRRNMKFRVSEEFEEIINLQQSMEIKIVCNDNDIVNDSLKVSRGVDLEKLRATSESKLEISKIEKDMENSQISCEINKKIINSSRENEALEKSALEIDLGFDKNQVDNSKHSRRQSCHINSSKLIVNYDENTSRNNANNTKSKFGSIEMDQTWRKLKVTAFIPEEKLIEAEDNELIFHSELNVVSFSDKGVPKPFSLRFCTLTKNDIKYFKSKEAYYRLVQPLFKLNLNNIISCSTILLDQTMFRKERALKYYFFYVKYLFNEDLIDMKSLGSISSNADSSRFNYRVVNINEENKRIKGKKIQPISSNCTQNPSAIEKTITKKESANTNAIETFLDLNNTVIFASISRDVVNKWACVLNYFIKR